MNAEKLLNINNPELLRAVNTELARRDFWEYCKLKDPTFYYDEREYLGELCNELQTFMNSDAKIQIINLPPRFGKTRTITHFCNWLYGQDKTTKILTGSYNTIVSTEFSRNVRDNISEEKFDDNPDKYVYNDIFPDTRIKRGDGAMNKWTLEGGHTSYLATSPDGTVTSFGGDWVIIDDLIKNSVEAFNDDRLEEQWRWFNDTLLSRTEGDFKIIIVFTRWSLNDLCGKIITNARRFGWKVRVFLRSAINGDGSMLCDSILSRKDYEFKTVGMDKAIADANYLQKPREIKGRLYGKFPQYEKLPRDADGNIIFRRRAVYCDTADTGSDYLSAMAYGESMGRKAYALDVLHSDANMTHTLPMFIQLLINNNVEYALIEGNNGGVGFARSVVQELKKLGRHDIKVDYFHQSANKKARILSNSVGVQRDIIMPVGYEVTWRDFNHALINFKKEGKNGHDDAPDCITGVYEMLHNKISGTIKTFEGGI